MWVCIGGESEGSGFLLHFFLAFYLYEHIFHQHCTMWEIFIFPVSLVLHIYSWTFISVPHIFQNQRSTFFITPNLSISVPLALPHLLCEPFSVSTPSFPCPLCSFTFFCPLLTATQSHLSVDRIVPICLIIVLAVFIKMLLGTRRFDLAWCFSVTVVAQILDLSWANHVNICCFLQDCYSSWFDSIQFDPIQLYVEYCNSHNTTVFNAFQHCRDQLTSTS